MKVGDPLASTSILFDRPFYSVKLCSIPVPAASLVVLRYSIDMNRLSGRHEDLEKTKKLNFDDIDINDDTRFSSLPFLPLLLPSVSSQCGVLSLI